MPSTPTYALPYPAAGDPADVPLDMQELAEAIEGHGPATEIAYAQITANVSIPIVAAASAVTIVAAGPVTFDGKPVLVEFFAAFLSAGASGTVILNLWDGSTDLGYFAQLSASPSAATSPVHAVRRLSPTAGSHTYSIKGWASGATGTINAGAGGGAGIYQPTFVRISRV